jgi:TM2 domain-containing membrane protein YozV
MNEPTPFDNNNRVPQPNLGVAAVLSFFFPGVGQIYKRQIFKGIIYFLITSGLYASVIGIPLALIIHLCVIIGASRPVKVQ